MLHLAQGMPSRFNSHHHDADSRTFQSASRLYQRAYGRGWLGQLWATLTRKPRHLINLAEVQPGSQAGNRYPAGVQTVPIDQIQGSHGRCHDFDSSFFPLQHHTRSRWLRVASARQQGVALPPVELTQIGEVYFVRDGHHRISVARALGQTDIEADVRIWQLTEPVVSKQ